MSASMAEVVGILQKHVALEDTWDHVPEGKIVCNWMACKFEIDADEDDHWRTTFAAHQAEQLAANGYGKLEDACAQALTDAADDFESNIGVAEFDDLAERNGSRWTHIADAWEHQGPYMDWLRNLAAMERGQCG